MPYIKKSDRVQYEKFLKEIESIKTKGDLEFCIFMLMTIYMHDKEYRYSTLHDCVYACIHAGEEFKRKNLDIRENEACLENGDI